MQLSLSGHHVEVTPSMRAYVEKKLERISRHFDHVIDVHCVLTVEKIKAIATLKLIGAANWVIVRLILEQSVVLTLASFALAWTLVNLTYDRFPRTLVLLPNETLITFGVFFVGGMLASLVGIVHALRTPPSLALGG